MHYLCYLDSLYTYFTCVNYIYKESIKYLRILFYKLLLNTETYVYSLLKYTYY